MTTSTRRQPHWWLCAVVWLLPAVGWGDAPNHSVGSRAAVSQPDSSSGRIPYRVLQSANGKLSISSLTRTYEKDLTVFLASQRVSPVDLETLDRYGYFPAWDTPVDSSGTHQLRRESVPEVAELTPEEKRELDPPKPGVSTGIPSPVAITGTLLGGVGLLIHVLSKLF